MSAALKQADLEAYLDESLAPDEMARIEVTLRANPALLEQLAAINARRDSGVHTLGEIWRRHRIGCPSREELGSFVLGAMSPPASAHIRFHIDTIGCRRCRSNLEDLLRQQRETGESTAQRRRKYFESSAGYLRKK